MIEGRAHGVLNRSRGLAQVLREEGPIRADRAWPVPVGFFASFALAGGLGVVLGGLSWWSRFELSDWLIAVFIAVPAVTVVVGYFRVFLETRPEYEIEVRHSHSDSERLASLVIKANQSIVDAADAIDDLRTEMQRQEARLKRILDEVEESQGWLVANEPMVQQYKKAQQKEDLAREKDQRRLNRRYFIAGILLSIPIGIIINLIT